MDESQLAPLLDTLTPDEIDAAAEELHAYARHRRIVAAAPPGAVMAPFSRVGFFKHVVKVVQALWPVIGPMVGLDTQAAAPARHE